MILSRTSQYAIQALIYIATQPRGVPVLNRTVAQHLSVPPAYLAKIMQNLCRGACSIRSVADREDFACGKAVKNRSDADSNPRRRAVLDRELRVMGLKICSDETACPMHAKWKPIKIKIVELLHKQTLEKLATAVKSGKYRLTELPHAALSMPFTRGTRNVEMAQLPIST